LAHRPGRQPLGGLHVLRTPTTLLRAGSALHEVGEQWRAGASWRAARSSRASNGLPARDRVGSGIMAERPPAATRPSRCSRTVWRPGRLAALILAFGTYSGAH
jgi:hypothetical protein